MSKASATGQVVFTRRFGVYMVSLTSNKGELFQQYTGSASNPSAINPDYTTASNQPTLELSVVSSRTTENVDIVSTTWKVNDTAITWSSNVSNTPPEFKGCFQKVDDSHIKIIKNLIVPSGGVSPVIKVEAKVSSNGGVEDNVQATYSIPISMTQGQWRNVNIVSDDTTYMTIRTHGGSSRLKCEVYNATAATYKWYKLVNSAWEQQSGTSATFTVTEAMVDTTAIIKCEAFDADGSLIGSDQATVLDLSDPLYIVPNPKKRVGNSGSESEIYDDVSIADTDPADTQVVFHPQLKSRDGSSVSGTPSWTYAFTDYAGNLLSPSPAPANCVTKAMCEQAGDISYYITADLI